MISIDFNAYVPSKSFGIFVKRDYFSLTINPWHMKTLIRLTVFLFISLSLYNCEKDKIDLPPDEVILEEFYSDSTGEIVTINVSGEDLVCTKIGDLYIYQGDMVFREPTSALKGAGITTKSKYWNCRTVYYAIEEGFPSENRIIEAIEHWEKYTDMQFVQRTNETNYIQFVESKNGCSSYVGMIGGSQKLRLADWATVGNVIHEIGHAIGLKHEHAKPNRDKYIIIHEENIRTKRENNFSKMQSAVFTEGLDFNSIMLYPPKAFSKNGEYTITKVDGSLYSAQRNQLSLDDIETVEAMYRVVDNECGSKEKDQITDIDNNTYQTIKIGNQWWMAKNLAATRLRDGTLIRNVTDNYTWWDTSEPAYSWFENDEESYKEPYGALYNWATVSTNLLCPAGWHVSTDDDWKEMEIYLGMSESEANQSGGRGEGIGGKLKMDGTEYWYLTNEGATNESGFSALPGGQRESIDGDFYNLGVTGYWWSVLREDGSDDKPNSRELYDMHTTIYRYTPDNNSGYSVRCVMDR